MDSEQRQISAINSELKQLRRDFDALLREFKKHKHTDTDGSQALDGTRVRSLIFQSQGNGRVPTVDGELFYNNGNGVQNFRLQMIDRNVNPPIPRNWTIDLSAL